MNNLLRTSVVTFLFLFSIKSYSQNEDTCNNSIEEIIFCLEDFNSQGDIFRLSFGEQRMTCSIDTITNDNLPKVYEEFHAKKVEHVYISLTSHEQDFLRNAILDFFVSRKDSIYAERTLVEGSYAFDVTPTYLSIIIRTEKSSLKYDLNILKGYNNSLQKIENIRFRYSLRFCKFLQFIQYIVANKIGGERWTRYKEDIEFYKKHPDFYVCDQFLSSQ